MTTFLIGSVCAALLTQGPITPTASVQARLKANAQAVRVTLIDADLTPARADLVRIETAESGQVRIASLDDQGKVVTAIGGENVMALAREWWIVDEASLLEPPVDGRPRAGWQSWIELTDGQRLVGGLSPTAADDGQSIRWTHPRFGVSEIPLDRITRLVLGASAARAAAEARPDGGEDRVFLINGDHVSGYVDAIGAEIVVSAADPKAPPIRLGLPQVAAITLANPAEPPEGMRLWLADGSVIRAHRIDVDAGEGRLQIAGALEDGEGQTEIDLSDLRGVVFDASRLTALAALPLTGHGPLGGRRLAEPPDRLPSLGVAGTGRGQSPLGADDIQLRGAMHATWSLPEGATRIGGWAGLEAGAWTWGDCVVTISVLGKDDQGIGREFWRRRLSGQSPLAHIDAALPAPAAPGSRIRIAIEPGERGSIQDRVVLRRVLVLSEP